MSARGAIWRGVASVAVVVLAGGGGALAAQSRKPDPAPVAVSVSVASTDVSAGDLRVDQQSPRTVDSYRGYGTWVDVFDYDPAYGTMPVGVGSLAEMAEDGVETLFLQSARMDERTPGGLVDPWLLAELIVASHAVDIDVVGWYLPRFAEGTEDLERLVAIHDFEVLGQRFDGLAVDIEWTGDGIDHETRTARLLALGSDLRDYIGSEEPLAAITQPPVLMEVVNPDFWPGFPWVEMADQYDVWMPMSYWSWRSAPYDNGFTYHEESVRRLRDNLGDPDALVHGIGGIGGVDGVDDPTDLPEPLATVDELERFVDSLVATESIGGSVYDWNTLEPAARELLSRALG